jgi:hypothetical protein
LACQDVNGNEKGDQHCSGDAGQGHVTAPLGECFTAGGIIHLFRGFVMK